MYLGDPVTSQETLSSRLILALTSRGRPVSLARVNGQRADIKRWKLGSR